MRILSLLTLLILVPALQAKTALGRALLAPAAEQPVLVRALLQEEDDRIRPVLEAWRSGEVFVFTSPDGDRVPFLLGEEMLADGRKPAFAAENGEPLLDEAGAPLAFAAHTLTALDTNAAIRRAIRDVSEVVGLSSSSPAVRRTAAERLGLTQRPDYLPMFEARLEREKVASVRRALEDGVALIRLKQGDEAAQLAALLQLEKSHHLGVLAQLKERLAENGFSPELAAAARRTIRSTESYYSWVNFWGTAFRGLSLGSVLLVTALGLAITYGLMGVINMAHGEIMVIGAYMTFVTQTLFVRWFGADSSAFHGYFWAALPVAFLSAAVAGLILERSVIQWLYRRPLESLLATWGVSLAMQQGFRTVFGPANVQITSPGFLQGNVTWFDITFAYNRLFVIGFAGFVVVGTWLLLTRTSFGLYVRAVTQNRGMASCMGIRTERVNMLTFAFGSGLAGLAGACLSQIGNVGPSLGQSHIVDCFMVVVAGGVGNLFGTVIAALGIGSIDQILQPWLGAVMGKILVLVAIILFLQWKPGGLFPTRNRSLD
jgi:urea transport system permease protein